VQALHTHLRRSVLPPLPAGRVRPIEMNSWGHVEHELSEEGLIRAIDQAADLGVELFTIDAGWYADRGTDWWPYVGDWRPGDRLPRGLEPVFDHARRKGLLCGLWFDAERMGDRSELYRDHQHWLVHRHGVPVAPQSPLGWSPRALDFTQPEVVAHVEATLCDRIERYRLDVFRLDFNTRIGRADGQTVRHGYTENTAWRNHDAVYAMYERIRRRFPHLLMENCAGGGGRNDLGMLANFHWAQMSDEWGAVRTLKTLNGFTLALPPEYGLSYIGFMSGENYRYGDLDFRLRVQLFGHYCLSSLAPTADELPPAAKARVRHAIDLYKRFVRPMLSTCRVYHHTPVLPNDQAGEWVVFEYVSDDVHRAYAGIFRLAGAREPTYVFRPRGLERDQRYRVTFDNTGTAVLVDGLELAHAGLPVYLDQRLTSELLLLERVE
jgi:alpha-galactosidase